MASRWFLSVALLLTPGTLYAKTVSLTCPVEQRDESSGLNESKSYKRFQFTFDTDGGQGTVEGFANAADGTPIQQTWTPDASITPTHVAFSFVEQLAPRTAITHTYRVDRSNLEFTGNIDFFGTLRSSLGGSCKQQVVQQRKNVF